MGQRLKTVVVKRRPRPRPTPVQAKPLADRLRQWLMLTAELSAVAGGVGFIVSAAFWTLVFNHWGISYLQTASPSDVVMGGLTVAIGLAMPLLVTVSLSGIAMWLVARFGLTKDRSTAIFAPAVVILYAATAASVFAAPSAVSIVLGVATITCVSAWLATRLAAPRHSHFLTLSAMVFAVSFIGGVANSTMTRGMSGGRITLQGTDCRLMWVGSQSMVARCADGFQIRRSDNFIASVRPKRSRSVSDNLIEIWRDNQSDSTEAPE